MKKRVGLIGYGVVAQGFYELLEKSDLAAQVTHICVKNPEKQRNLPAHLFTTDFEQIITNPEVDIVVELIDDAEIAFEIAKQAMACGKPLITANKKMLAENLSQVSIWHQTQSTPLRYEAAVAGSIPILSTLDQFYRHLPILEIRGILNGSTNYILSTMRTQQLSMDEALALAQKNGFAESDPTLDISGKDALYKLAILSYHAFGEIITDFDQVRVESITNMEDQFFEMAAERGMKIKSIATASVKAGKLKLKVQPELLSSEDPLFEVENEDNAVQVMSPISGPQLYIGKGAAVLQDLQQVLTGLSYHPKFQTANSEAQVY